MSETPQQPDRLIPALLLGGAGLLVLGGLALWQRQGLAVWLDAAISFCM